MGSAPLRRAITGQAGPVIASMALLAGWQAAEAMVPVLVGVVVDEAVATGDLVALTGWLAVLAALFTMLSLGFRFGARVGARAREQAAVELRVAIARRILDPRGGAAAGRRPGELLSIATEDVSRVAAFVEVVGGAVIAAAGLTVAAVVLLGASVTLGLVVLAGLPPVLLLLNLLTGPLDRRSTAEQERAAEATAVAADLVTGLRVLKGLRAEAAGAARYRRSSHASLHARLRATRLTAAQSGATLAVTSAFLAVVALVGGRLAAAGEIGVGELVAAVGLAQYLIGPLGGIGRTAAGYARCRASARRVAAVLDAPPAVGESDGVPGDGGLAATGLVHGPLRGLDIAVEPDELVGVVTPDPADAAALLGCLAREVEPTAGHLHVGGVPVSRLRLDALRGHLLVAAHEPDLFEPTPLTNVASTAAAPSRVGPALAASAADEVLAGVGAQTPLTERARSLSGGQRQRLALARALATDAPVLVLHDPTTAVDAVTEARIAERLPGLRAGRATVVVTTSPALLAAADRVLLVVNGLVAAEGTHAELAAGSARYREAVLG